MTRQEAVQAAAREVIEHGATNDEIKAEMKRQRPA